MICDACATSAFSEGGVKGFDISWEQVEASHDIEPDGWITEEAVPEVKIPVEIEVVDISETSSWSVDPASNPV